MRRIAPDAARVADRQPDKDAGQSGKCRFALNAAIDLMDQELPRRLVSQELQAGIAIVGHNVHRTSYLEKGVIFSILSRCFPDTSQPGKLLSLRTRLQVISRQTRSYPIARALEERPMSTKMDRGRS